MGQLSRTPPPPAAAGVSASRSAARGATAGGGGESATPAGQSLITPVASSLQHAAHPTSTSESRTSQDYLQRKNSAPLNRNVTGASNRRTARA